MGEPLITLEKNIEVSLYELGNLRSKFDTPDHSNIGRHFAQIKEYLQDALHQIKKDDEVLRLRKALEKIEEKSGYDDKGNLMLDYEQIYFIATKALERE